MLTWLYLREPCWKTLFLSVICVIILDDTQIRSHLDPMAQCMLNRLLRHYFSHVLGGQFSTCKIECLIRVMYQIFSWKKCKIWPQSSTMMSLTEITVREYIHTHPPCPYTLLHFISCTFSVWYERHHHVTKQSSSLWRATLPAARLCFESFEVSLFPMPPPFRPTYGDFSCC